MLTDKANANNATALESWFRMLLPKENEIAKSATLQISTLEQSDAAALGCRSPRLVGGLQSFSVFTDT
jgi:hypothetical protein